MLILKDTDFEPLHERAWQKLLKSEPSHFHLREVIKYSCGSVREQAGAKTI
jgi:beta-phosphoglucomutase-like phosphatase (HAD superfamily)